jgi:hypothetical protein
VGMFDQASSFLSCHADQLTEVGRRRLVRHGHLPEREIMTGIGAVAVRCPRARSRSATNLFSRAFSASCCFRRLMSFG